MRSPRDLFDAAPELLPEGLREPAERDEAIAALTRFSLLRADPSTLAVHRLVQAVTRDGLDEQSTRGRAETAIQLLDAAWPGMAWEHPLWPRMSTLLSHVLASAAHAERLGMVPLALGALLNNSGTYLTALNTWSEAEPLLRRAIAIGEGTLGPEHPDLAIRLNNLAIACQELGYFAEAESLYQRAVAIGERTLGPAHRDLATRLNNLANLYQVTKRYTLAEPLFVRALEIDEQVLGPDHPDLAIDLNNLATLYHDWDRHSEAEPLYKRAIAIDEMAGGPEESGSCYRPQ